MVDVRLVMFYLLCCYLTFYFSLPFVFYPYSPVLLICKIIKKYII